MLVSLMQGFVYGSSLHHKISSTISYDDTILNYYCQGFCPCTNCRKNLTNPSSMYSYDFRCTAPPEAHGFQRHRVLSMFVVVRMRCAPGSDVRMLICHQNNGGLIILKRENCKL